MKKILIATNYFKGSLSAIDAAKAIERGIKSVNGNIETVVVPIADGGDGTLDSVVHFSDCSVKKSKVSDPFGRSVEAKWLVLERDSKKIAFIEAAQANGLSLLSPGEYDPVRASTYGVGELMKIALDETCDEIIVTIGGSATNDGGAGMLQALGVSFLDSEKNEIAQGGGALQKISNIDIQGLDKRLNATKITVACDVDNPLCGPNGASAVYGPQKGACPETVKLLDNNLAHFADISSQVLGHDAREQKGAGAAGGIGFALKAYLNATMTPGFDIVADLAGMESKLEGASLVITSEGRLDSQSLSGKAPYSVAQMAKKYDIPVVVFSGAVERGLSFENTNICGAFSIADGPIGLDDSMNNAAYLLESTAKQLISVLETVNL